ncbi:hypothetical protein R1flu_019442 [Riccia fluitans]|uniref:Secreted peptide n=1 Tax=Riccia fluitans TaxID=41844 RepID=A0ABD1ZIN7_9MARC
MSICCTTIFMAAPPAVAATAATTLVVFVAVVCAGVRFASPILFVTSQNPSVFSLFLVWDCYKEYPVSSNFNHAIVLRQFDAILNCCRVYFICRFFLF